MTSGEHVDQDQAEHVNSSGPAPAAAAAAPCGCGDKLDKLEAQLGATGQAVKVIGYLAILAAAAVLYVLWADIRGSDDG